MVEKNHVAEWLAENPKTMGILWTLMLLLAETGTVAASHSNVITGP